MSKSFMSRVNVGQSVVRSALSALGAKKKSNVVAASTAQTSSEDNVSASETNELRKTVEMAPKQAFTSPTSGLQIGADTTSRTGEKSLNDAASVSGQAKAKAKAVEAQPTYLGYLSGVVSTFWPSSTPSPPSVVPVKKAEEKLSTVAPKVLPSVKRVSRSEIDNRTKGLFKKLLSAESSSSRLLRTEELCRHLVQYPETRGIACNEKDVIRVLMKRVRESKDTVLKAQTRECLSLLGYVDPPRGQGIRILSIDGGGTRGMMGLEVLEALEKECNGRKICDMFDHIIGVSTGGIIAALLGGRRLEVSRCREIYMEISRELFSQGRFSGVSGLLLSHSYYNTKKWVEILKRTLGDDTTVLETCREPNSPKLSIVSCIVNNPQLQAYIFRNYEYPLGRDSQYRGGCGHKMWQALQASAAAPGYFEEVCLGHMLHQDGGVLVNNPTAIGLHEARLLWPDSAIQCVVSVGNGRSVTVPVEIPDKVPTFSGLQEKIAKIVDSATDTELVHTALRDLLPSTDYFRLNPYMTHPYTLDEINPAKLDQMQADARMYVRKNHRKIQSAARRLLDPRAPVQKLVDRFNYEKAVRLGRWDR